MSANDPHYEHRACHVCGAKTDQQAGNMCQLYAVGDTGEYGCKGGAEEESYPDGRLRFKTDEWYAAEEKWFEDQMPRSETSHDDRD